MKNKIYLISPLALFQVLSRNVIVISHTLNSWIILATCLKRFVILIETPNNIQFAIKDKIFNVLNEKSFYLQESFLYTLLGLPISWQGELSYLRGLQTRSSYIETGRLGGIQSNSGLEFGMTPSYDATRFYVSIIYSLTSKPSLFLPKGWQRAWHMSENWTVYTKYNTRLQFRSYVTTLTSSFYIPLSTLISLNHIQKDIKLGEGLPNYFIGLLSSHNSTFNYVTCRGRIILQFFSPYSQFSNRNVDSIW